MYRYPYPPWKVVVSKIQPVQNSELAARLVTKTRRVDHIMPILHKLHWLPVHKRFILRFYFLLKKFYTV